MKRKNSLLFIFSAVIFSMINELMLRITSLVIFQYFSTDPLFFIDHGKYYALNYLNIYVFVLIQFIILSSIFIIFRVLKKIKISYKLMILNSLIISFISYYSSSPKQLNLFGFLTKNIFSIYSYGALIFHIFTVALLIYFFLRQYDK